MSYNIDSTEYLSGKLRIVASVASALQDEFEEELPEDCFLYDLKWDDEAEEVEITNPSWQGISSGDSYDLLAEEILPRTLGEAVIMFTWEGGDAFSALAVKDGVVTKKKVKHTAEVDEDAE